MAYKKNGQLTTTLEHAKHLCKFLKRRFWKAERKAGKLSVKNFTKRISQSRFCVVKTRSFLLIISSLRIYIFRLMTYLYTLKNVRNILI